MIDMRVGQDNDIDLIDRNGNFEILVVALATLALKETAIQKDGLPTDVEYVTRTSDLARSTDEFNLHYSLEDGGPRQSALGCSWSLRCLAWSVE